jgi:hypothetical protein
MIGFEATLRTQPSREFKSDERTHAVAQQRKRPIEKRNDLARERFDQRLKVRETRFAQTELTSGQHRRNDFDVPIYQPGPGTKNRAAATGIRETEQPKASPGIRLYLKPRLLRECPGTGSRAW